jgi:PKD repeat protein/pimeloyl-ACP methyl ester carboxylesterase
MKKYLLLIVFTMLLTLSYAGNSPYPIIFVHGLGGSDASFFTMMNWLSDKYSDSNNQIKVYDVLLNKDNDNNTSLMESDVRNSEFNYTLNGNSYEFTVRLGKRMYSESTFDYVHYWEGSSNIYAINFDDERIWGTYGYFKYSNQSAIMKQGYALSLMIQEVLTNSGAEKVILVGHSMGGLAIREYLQRTYDNTTSTNHRWWIEQDSPFGHKVAQVVTIGTPHLGYAISDYFRNEIDLGTITNTEAYRDLKSGYNVFVNRGRYLFGGNESTMPSFWNKDVNCNGSESDVITGINQEPDGTVDNYSIPLPPNIKYTWITATVGNRNDDGVVQLDKQWLYNYAFQPAPTPAIADTLYFHMNGDNYEHAWEAHMDEPEQISPIIRGLDEGDNNYFAYTITNDKWYSGFITYNPEHNNQDIDVYKYISSFDTDQTLEIYPNNSGVDWIEVKNQAGDIIINRQILLEGRNVFRFVVAANEVLYVTLEGTAFSNSEGNSFDNTYDFRLYQTVISIRADFHASRRAGTTQTVFSFFDDSEVENTDISHWYWDLNGDGEIESTLQNPTWTYSTPGVYNVILRVKDGGEDVGNDGIHADYEMKYSYITVNGAPSGNTDEIVWMEYFIDTDPGVDNGVPVFLVPAPEITVQVSIDIGNLTEGLHRLYFRAKDETGRWGLPQCKPFIVQQTSPQQPLPDITQMEYFIDTSVSPGGGTGIAISPSDDVTTNTIITLSNLNEGLHRLYVRAKDEHGRWGLPQCKPFIVQQTSPQQPLPDITQMEYFIDTSVSPGGGTTIAISPSDDVTTNTNITLSNLNEGLHRLYVRAKDEHGRWGLPQCKPFIVQQTSPQQPLPTVTQLEYFYDNDPGIGQGNLIYVSPSLSDVTVNASLPVDQLSLGNHTLYVRAKDSLDRWGLPQSMGFQLVIRPDTPENAIIQVINGALVISWDTVQQIDGYKIYASDNPDSGFEDVSGLGNIITATNRVSWATPLSTATYKFYYVKSYRSDTSKETRLSKEEVSETRKSKQ